MRTRPPTFAHSLKTHREELKLTQEEAADRLGMSRRAFIELEMGRRKPRLYEVQGIMAIFGQNAVKAKETASVPVHQ